jgi:hypothetical protein
MSYRVVLYDALKSLEEGNALVHISDFSWGYYLDGVPFVSCIFNMMLRSGWITRAAHTHPDCQVAHYHITDQGKAILEDGKRWYSKQTFLRKIMLRLWF